LRATPIKLTTEEFREVGEALGAYLSNAVAIIKDRVPGILASISWSGNTIASPFLGYAGLFAYSDVNRAEDCTLAMEVQYSERRHFAIVIIDISDGHGNLFAAAPELSSPDTGSDAEMLEFVLSAEKAAEEFFTAHLDLVCQVLLAAEQRAD
jgi:hypothetical protein